MIQHKKEFLSTLSLRRATLKNHIFIHHNLFLSTLSLRRATLGGLWVLSTQIFLSTLSLRRATSANCSCHSARPDFYPRSPCGERRLLMYFWPCGLLFLSTLSLRRATPTATGNDKDNMISIHALLAESDKGTCNLLDAHRVFLSTLSLRRATLGAW